MSLAWVSADLRTGRVLADLPTLIPQYPLRRTIGRYETATAQLDLDGAPPNWERAVMEYGAVLAAYDDADPARGIQWAGIVTKQRRNTTDSSVELTLATAEAYLERRYVGDRTYQQVGQKRIAALLVDDFIVDTDAAPGIQLAVDYSDDGTPRDREYHDTDNQTVYTRLSQLMGVQGGVEFTIEWAWGPTHESLAPTLYLDERIGSAKPAGLDPAATFDLPGCVTEAEQVRDYSAGKGANTVQAYSSGQGDSVPTSGPVAAVDFKDRPTIEYRWSPGSSIRDDATLTEYARQAVAILSPGARALTLTAALGDAPRYGERWRLGDDVGYVLGGLDKDGRDTVPVFPGGLSGYGRVIAFELDAETITPVLAEAAIYTESGVTA